MKKLFFVLLTSVVLASCTKNNEGDKDITLTGGTSSSQTVYADDTQKSDGIKFNATAPWTATVSGVAVRAGSDIEWLTLSAYEGKAGEQSLTLILLPNTTGSDRRAEIRITSGSTTIKITVEQKGIENPNPQKPKYNRYVKKVTTSEVYWKSEMTFIYDDQKRISQIAVRNEDSNTNYPEENGVYNVLAKFSYDGNTISYTVEDPEDGNVSGSIKLNDKGFVIEETMTGKYGEDNSDVITQGISNYTNHVASSNCVSTKGTSITHNLLNTIKYSYDSYNYLQKAEDAYKCIDHQNCSANRIYSTTYIWNSNGNIAHKAFITDDSDSAPTNYELSYSPYINKSDCNLDLTYLLARDIFQGTVSETLGLTGKRCRNFVSSVTEKSSNSEWIYNYTYQFDKDGYVVKCTGGRSGSRNAIISIEYY